MKPVARDGFIMKLMLLKVQGPSFAHFRSKALEWALKMS